MRFPLQVQGYQALLRGSLSDFTLASIDEVSPVIPAGQSPRLRLIAPTFKIIGTGFSGAGKQTFLKLGVITIKVSDSNISNLKDIQAGGASAIHLDLKKAEREILLKACRLYRARIPNYLKSKQAEFQMMDNIIRKLT